MSDRELFWMRVLIALHRSAQSWLQGLKEDNEERFHCFLGVFILVCSYFISKVRESFPFVIQIVSYI